jgi:hypothetical protein
LCTTARVVKGGFGKECTDFLDDPALILGSFCQALAIPADSISRLPGDGATSVEPGESKLATQEYTYYQGAQP